MPVKSSTLSQGQRKGSTTSSIASSTRNVDKSSPMARGNGGSGKSSTFGRKTSRDTSDFTPKASTRSTPIAIVNASHVTNEELLAQSSHFSPVDVETMSCADNKSFKVNPAVRDELSHIVSKQRDAAHSLNSSENYMTREHLDSFRRSQSARPVGSHDSNDVDFEHSQRLKEYLLPNAVSEDLEDDGANSSSTATATVAYMNVGNVSRYHLAASITGSNRDSLNSSSMAAPLSASSHSSQLFFDDEPSAMGASNASSTAAKSSKSLSAALGYAVRSNTLVTLLQQLPEDHLLNLAKLVAHEVEHRRLHDAAAVRESADQSPHVSRSASGRPASRGSNPSATPSSGANSASASTPSSANAATGGGSSSGKALKRAASASTAEPSPFAASPMTTTSNFQDVRRQMPATSPHTHSHAHTHTHTPTSSPAHMQTSTSGATPVSVAVSVNALAASSAATSSGRSALGKSLTPNTDFLRQRYAKVEEDDETELNDAFAHLNRDSPYAARPASRSGGAVPPTADLLLPYGDRAHAQQSLSVASSPMAAAAFASSRASSKASTPAPGGLAANLGASLGASLGLSVSVSQSVPQAQGSQAQSQGAQSQAAEAGGRPGSRLAGTPSKRSHTSSSDPSHPSVHASQPQPQTQSMQTQAQTQAQTQEALPPSLSIPPSRSFQSLTAHVVSPTAAQEVVVSPVKVLLALSRQASGNDSVCSDSTADMFEFYPMDDAVARAGGLDQLLSRDRFSSRELVPSPFSAFDDNSISSNRSSKKKSSSAHAHAHGHGSSHGHVARVRK